MWRFGLVAVLACVVEFGAVALVPVEAGAKGVPGDDAEAPPGITVTGIGFGQRDGEATDRAVADARRRAATVADALGVAVGATEAIETPGLTQFGNTRPCPHRKGSSACPRATHAAAAIVTFAIPGGGGTDARRTIGSEGVAVTRVETRDGDVSRSIKRAILAARREATPLAAADAARRARIAARAADLTLGALVSVSEAALAYYYGPVFYDPALGTFGPGRFCGIVRRPVVRRDPDTDETRVVRRVPRRSCYSPTSYSLRFAVTYEAG